MPNLLVSSKGNSEKPANLQIFHTLQRQSQESQRNQSPTTREAETPTNESKMTMKSNQVTQEDLDYSLYKQPHLEVSLNKKGDKPPSLKKLSSNQMLSMGGGFKNTTTSYWIMQDLNRKGIPSEPIQMIPRPSQRKVSQEAIIKDINLTFNEMQLNPNAKVERQQY